MQLFVYKRQKIKRIARLIQIYSRLFIVIYNFFYKFHIILILARLTMILDHTFVVTGTQIMEYYNCAKPP